MNYLNYNTESEERKRGQHLQREERGIIWQMNRAKHSNRAIARTIGCSPSTIGNELRHGTQNRKYFVRLGSHWRTSTFPIQMWQVFHLSSAPAQLFHLFTSFY